MSEPKTRFELERVVLDLAAAAYPSSGDNHDPVCPWLVIPEFLLDAEPFNMSTGSGTLYLHNYEHGILSAEFVGWVKITSELLVSQADDGVSSFGISLARLRVRGAHLRGLCQLPKTEQIGYRVRLYHPGHAQWGADNRVLLDVFTTEFPTLAHLQSLLKLQRFAVFDNLVAQARYQACVIEDPDRAEDMQPELSQVDLDIEDFNVGVSQILLALRKHYDLRDHPEKFTSIEASMWDGNIDITRVMAYPLPSSGGHPFCPEAINL